MKAKIKDLESFFKNEVWLYDHEDNADPARVLKAHFILAWKKNEDGAPRARARLITQGFKDPDALSGALTTNATDFDKTGKRHDFEHLPTLLLEDVHLRYHDSIPAGKELRRRI